MKKKTYTVVGYYATPDQRYLNYVTAKTPEDAEEKALSTESEDLGIVATFEGRLKAADKETKVGSL